MANRKDAVLKLQLDFTGCFGDFNMAEHNRGNISEVSFKCTSVVAR